MEATLYHEHTEYIEDENSFQRVVPENMRSLGYEKDFTVKTKKHVLEDIPKEIDSIISNFGDYSNAGEKKGSATYSMADADFINMIKNEYKPVNILPDIKIKYEESTSPHRKLFYKIPVTVYHASGKSLSLGNLIEYFKAGCDFPCIVEFNLKKMMERSQEMINIWAKTTRSIMSLPEEIMEMTQKVKKIPVKTFGFETVNTHGTITKGYLNKCKIIEKINIQRYAIYVSGIDFVVNTTRWE
jgi:hypothetical protein